jgi:hypothetical protein
MITYKKTDGKETKMTFLQVCLGLDKVHSSISAQQGEIN